MLSCLMAELQAYYLYNVDFTDLEGKSKADSPPATASYMPLPA